MVLSVGHWLVITAGVDYKAIVGGEVSVARIHFLSVSQCLTELRNTFDYIDLIYYCKLY